MHEKISWMIIYPLFLLLACILYEGNILFLTLAFLLTMSIYEIGYLDNDFRTVIAEVNPTIRCNEERNLISNNLKAILASRIIYSTAIIVFFFRKLDNSEFIKLSLLLVLLSLGFYLHNSIRSRWNIFTYITIVSCRYVIPLLASINIGLGLTIFVIIIFPMIRTIEHSCKNKYNLPLIRKIVTEPDAFRVKSYGLIFIVSLLIFVGVGEYRFLILSAYFLLYRIATKYMADKKIANRVQHESYKWKDK